MSFHVGVSEESLLELFESTLQHGEENSSDAHVVTRCRCPGGFTAAINGKTARDVTGGYVVTLCNGGWL